MLVMAALAGACGGGVGDSRPSRRAPDPARLTVRFENAPVLPSLHLTAGGDSAVGLVGDAATGGAESVRLVIRPPRDLMASERLCGVIASGLARPTVVDWGLPVDTTRPPLVARLVAGARVRGLRFLLPGAEAKYVFEGISANGARVSLHWPVRSDRPVPAGAPDSVIERVIMPTASMLDSLVASLRITGAAVGPDDGSREPMPNPRREAAVLLDGVIPRYDVTLSPPCMTVTYAVPVVARIDSRLRLTVPPGATVEALASAEDGAVRVAFEEAPPAAEPATRESVPTAAITAGASGLVTLRVRLQVVPRAQAARQLVLVRLRASADPGADR